MVQRPTLLLLIPHLSGGGAEQVTAVLARSLSREKYDLHLGLITESAPSAEIPPWVTVHALGAPRTRYAVLPLLQLVRTVRPTVVLSSMAHLNFLVLLLRPFFPRNTRVLIRQNVTISAALAHGAPPFWTPLCYRLLYRHADRIISQSSAMAADLARELRIDPELIAVLPNPVDVSAILAAASDPAPWPGPGPHLLAVGRLDPIKGFDLLLHALAQVRASFPAVTLTILGSGPEDAALRALATSLGLADAVRLPGRVDPPYRYYPDATLFVLSSRHDAMPNALLEAAAAGLPIVATAASGGLTDLLRDHPGAWLAAEPSGAALASALTTALQSIQPGQRFDHTFVEVSARSSPIGVRSS